MKTVFSLLFLSIVGVSLAGRPHQPAQLVVADFSSNYDQLISAITNLNTISATADWTSVQSQFFKTRIEYKRVEALMEYFDREFVKDHINGAPLPKIERKTPDLTVLEPSGFQIAEEELMAENRAAFVILIKKLKGKILEFQPRIKREYVSERMIFEATREELIRLAALGITGFDTPSGINTIAECKTVVVGLKDITERYHQHLSPGDQQAIHALFEVALSYFDDNPGFDEFDRYGFIKHFINPAYGMVLQAQKNLKVETRDLGAETEYSVNYGTSSIFDTDFLNYRYFSKYSNSGIEEDKIVLGQMLFFDPILSANNKRACASCHQPDKAFTDGYKTSMTFDGEGFIQRNSPSLINSIYNSRFFWDARATTPEDQIEHVIFNEKEFNTNYDEIIQKLKQSEAYVQLYAKAFPESKTISRYTTVASISAYIQSLRSFNSTFDQLITDRDQRDDEEIKKGFNLFAGKAACATCHFIPTFAGNVPPLYEETETEVLGIPDTNDQQSAQLDQDMGRYRNGRPKEKAPFYKHSFKTASLRNIALTAPYMHNGVFNTLEEVIEFYDVGGGHGWGIAPENTTLPSDSLHLSADEKAAIISFVKALTDTSGLTTMPSVLPFFDEADLQNRPIGGEY